MSLDLLKEKFGYSGFTKETDNKEKIHERLSTRFIHEKEVDNREKIHEKLNAQFNTNVDFKSIKVQHQEELDEKQRIIESLEIQIDNLNESKRMEDKINLTTKQIYEDKIKKMSYVDSSNLIPILIEGIFILGISIIPLEEFPITKSNCFTNEKYENRFRGGYFMCRCGLPNDWATYVAIDASAI